MSRTAFALRFKSLVGTAPLAYLVDWRMRLAERALRESEVQVSALALALGYASESGLSNAFKRARGLSPLRYRTAARLRPGPRLQADAFSSTGFSTA